MEYTYQKKAVIFADINGYIYCPCSTETMKTPVAGWIGQFEENYQEVTRKKIV